MRWVFAEVFFFFFYKDTPFVLAVICQTPAGVTLVEYECVFNVAWLERKRERKPLYFVQNVYFASIKYALIISSKV